MPRLFRVSKTRASAPITALWPSTPNNLQALLAQCTAMSVTPPKPHHPITCQGPLYLEEDGRFGCDHAEAPAHDERTEACLNQTVAILLFEVLAASGGTVKLDRDS